MLANPMVHPIDASWLVPRSRAPPGKTRTQKPFMITEFMVRGSLRTVLQTGTAFELSWDVRHRMATQIAKGMEYLHMLGILDLGLVLSVILAISDMFPHSINLSNMPPRAGRVPFPKKL